MGCESYCILNFRFWGKALKLVVAFAPIVQQCPISLPGFNKNSFTPMIHRAQRFPIYSNQEHLLSKSTLIPPQSQKMT